MEEGDGGGCAPAPARVPIRSMTDDDLAFHRASLCIECE